MRAKKIFSLFIIFLVAMIMSLVVVADDEGPGDGDSDGGQGPGDGDSDGGQGPGDGDSDGRDGPDRDRDDTPPPTTTTPTPTTTTTDDDDERRDGPDEEVSEPEPAEPEPVVVTNTAPTLNIPDQTVNEDAGVLDNLVDLVSFVVDDITAAINMVFSVVSQTNANIVSCSLDSGRFIDCVTQSNQFGTSDVTVSATDEGNLTSLDTFTINVQSVNDAPSVNILEPGSKVTENEDFNLVATATDVEGSSLTYTVDFGDGTTKTGSVVNGRIELTHRYENEGTYTITVTASDGSTTGSDSLTVKTTEPPTLDIQNIIYIGSIAFEDEFVRPGDELTIFLNFENKGDEDIRDSRITAIIQDLGVRSRTLSADVDDNDKSSRTLSLEIPETAQKGRYWVEIVIDIDGDRRVKYRPIDVI